MRESKRERERAGRGEERNAILVIRCARPRGFRFQEEKREPTMGYNAMANGASAPAAAAAPRDIAGAGKKKRANRSAKLKQCKLDARREQWLSQVKGKDSKGTNMAASPTSPLPPHPLSLPRARTGQSDSGRRRRTEEEQALHDSSDSESLTHSPTSSGSGHLSRKGRSANSVGSTCSVESSSRTVSDAELEEGGEEVDIGGENAPLDDWEAVADALSANNSHSGRNIDPSAVSVIRPNASPNSPGSLEGAPGCSPTKREPIRTLPRAWRLDDASRPRSLPSLTKQRSFKVEMERRCGLAHSCSILSSPSTCPICCEDLDVTDSSFLPCMCGFHLCLFCYKRILEEDGRCPGCRKQYCPMAGREMAVTGGGISFKFSRSCSMSSGS